MCIDNNRRRAAFGEVKQGPNQFPKNVRAFGYLSIWYISWYYEPKLQQRSKFREFSQ